MKEKRGNLVLNSFEVDFDHLAETLKIVEQDVDCLPVKDKICLQQ